VEYRFGILVQENTLKRGGSTVMKKCLAFAVVFGLVLVLAGVAAASDTTTVSVSANVVGTCKFVTGGTMEFGELDPADGADVNAAVTQPTFWCTKGASYTIDDDQGLNKLGDLYRMKHSGGDEYIPYTFTYNTTGTGAGPTISILMNITGQIAGSDYQNASAGDYSDTVTLTITP
jgi:spore coat protein U-like protein